MHKRWLRISLCAGLALCLSACGFHLQRGATLPPGMQRIHLSIRGGGDFPRDLARALETSGATLVDEPAPGVAEFRVPVARFRTVALTFTGHARVGEYAVHYQVQFEVRDSQGQRIVPLQKLQMSRAFTYDARQPAGTAAQTEAIHESLVKDMVQGVLLRLRAAAEQAAPAASASTPAAAVSDAVDLH